MKIKNGLMYEKDGWKYISVKGEPKERTILLESIIEATVNAVAATNLEIVSQIVYFSFYASLILDYTVDS